MSDDGFKLSFVLFLAMSASAFIGATVYAFLHEARTAEAKKARVLHCAQDNAIALCMCWIEGRCD